MRRRWAIDLSTEGWRATGIERFSRNLALALRAAGWSGAYLVPTIAAGERLGLPPERLIPTGGGSMLGRIEVSVPRAIAGLDALSGVIFPGFPPGLAVWPIAKLRGLRVARVLYDTTMWRRPNDVTWKTRVYFRPKERLAIALSDRLLTISRDAAEDFGALFPNSGGRIGLIGGGFDQDIVSRALAMDPTAIEQQLRSVRVEPREYFLAVGTLDGRRNYEVVIRALAHMEADCQVLFAGRDAGALDRLQRLAQDLGVADRIRVLGFVDDKVLASLYQGALATLCPSRREGLGMPALESMAMGIPVVAANAGALREVVAGAGICVDPDDPKAWAHSLDRLWREPDWSMKLGVRGQRRASSYSWDRVAERTVREIAALC